MGEHEHINYPECPDCGCQDLWRRGTNSAGTRQFQCKNCKRVFVPSPYLPDYVIVIADRMLRSGMDVPVAADLLAGFCSRRWLYERRKVL